MSRFKQGLFVCMLLALGATGIGTSWAGRSAADGVHRFATLPDGVRFPEGITANPATGEIFVATFDFGPNANQLLRYDRQGRLVAQRDFGGTPLLGLAFGPSDGKVYIANFGTAKIQRIDANFDAGSAIEDVADLTVGGAPNAMVFDSSGNLYVSDSFQGAIYRIADAQTCATPCAAPPLVTDPQLTTTGFPPFGANGLALSEDESKLFVANTGDDRILWVNMATTEINVFAQSVNGADGIAFDRRGTLWVAANQADDIEGLNGNGRVDVKLGGFGGIRRDGSPDGLLFPASIVIMGDDMYVTNLAIALTPAAGDEWEDDVTRWNIVRVRLPHH